MRLSGPDAGRMRHRYLHLDPELLRQLLAGLDLLRLFNQLLLATGGDVEEAMELDALPPGAGATSTRRSTSRRSSPASRSSSSSSATARAGSCSPAGGERRIRTSAFEEIFSEPAQARAPATTRSAPPARASSALPETRPYEFGDDLHRLDSVALARQRAEAHRSGELELAEEDLEVYETEHLTSCATVLVIDVSHSMILYGEDRITPAKTVALALTELITTQYPKDTSTVILFGDRAERVAALRAPLRRGRAVPHQHPRGACSSRAASSRAASSPTSRSS